MPMSPVLVVTGPPGAGKTTLARLIAASQPTSVHLHADDFWHHLVTGYVDAWLPEAQHQNDVVMTAVVAAMSAYWAGGYSVVLDGVVGPWYLDSLLAAVPTGLAIDYAILRPRLEVALERVRTRADHGMRDPDATVHMHREFMGIGTEYDDHVFDSGTLSLQELHEGIQQARAEGRLRLPGLAPAKP